MVELIQCKKIVIVVVIQGQAGENIVVFSYGVSQ